MEVRDCYFNWLCDIVDANDSDHSFKNLMGVLFDIPFEGFVGNDINREEDGKYLRNEFADTHNYLSYAPIEGPCNVLEMMIGVASRMENLLWDPDFGDRTAHWFWLMIQNLELDRLDDMHWRGDSSLIYAEQTIDIFVHRMYDPDGSGGLFPLRKPSEDQRKVEIWYQMSAYIDENLMPEDDEFE